MNKIGIAKNTKVEEYIDKMYKGETYEVGVYLAMARQAQREGYPEIAEVLIRIAMEEAAHAARYAELNGMISESTKENLKKMAEGEGKAAEMRGEVAKIAKEEGLDEVHDAVDEIRRDELRHQAALKGLLKRYFGE